MNNKTILILFLTLVGITGCTTTLEQKITENAVITIKNYGAFSPVEMATQLLTIDKDTTILQYFNGDGTLTKEYRKATDKAEFQKLIGLFEKNSFVSMDAFYTVKEGEPVVTDVGIGEITIIDGKVQKTVKIDPYFEDYMPEGLKEINDILSSFRLNVLSSTEAEAKTMAEEWVKQAPTYKNGGSGLKLVNYVVEESYPEMHILTYGFTNSHAGYGENKVAAQVITNHTIVVTVFLREVSDAVIDNKWDERSQVEITLETPVEPVDDESFITLKYQPKQCEVLPWVKWEDENLIQWFEEPTVEEIVISYFGSMDIEAVNFQKIETDMMACEACGVCPTTYHYTVEIKESGIEKAKELGWNEASASLN